MTNNHKYIKNEGCCICGTKHSTSQFRPWYEHYDEDTLCRVFSLDTLDGRRGYICNPCVLFIKRTIQSMDNNTLNSDPSKRLDSKLKGCRGMKTSNLMPVEVKPSQSTKEHGNFTRNKRFAPIVPKYVFTGKPYIPMKESVEYYLCSQLQDYKVSLEEESDAEDDLPYYRRPTMRKGMKTLQKQEKMLADTAENQRLLGKTETSAGEYGEEIHDGDGYNIPDRTRMSELGGPVMKRSYDQYSMAGPKTYGTRSKGNAAIKEKGKASCHEDDEDTDTSDEMLDEEENLLNAPPSIRESHHGLTSRNNKRKSGASGVTGNSHVLEAGLKRRRLIAKCRLLKMKNRRVIMYPVKNFKRHVKTFMDPSYWLKFSFCCCTCYVEMLFGSFTLHREKHKITVCSICLEKILNLRQEVDLALEARRKYRLQQRKKALAIAARKRLQERKQSLTSTQSTTSLDGLPVMNTSTPKANEADEEWDADSVLSMELRQSRSASHPSTSSLDGLPYSNVSTPKPGAYQESEIGSVVSSGEDDLNDNRMNFNNSPSLEKACRGFFS